MSYGTTMDGVNLDSSSSSYYKAGPVASVKQQPDLQSKLFALSSNYNIGEASYPEGVASDSDKQHYIRFFINMRSKSEFLVSSKEKERDTSKAVSTAEQEAFRKQLGQQQRITQFESARTAGSVLSGSKAGTLVLGAIGIMNKSKLGATIGSGVGAVGGGAVGKEIVDATAQNETSSYHNIGAQSTREVESKIDGNLFGDLKTDEPRRISDVITLHIQDRPAVNYSVQYNDNDLGVFGGLLANSDLSSLATVDGITQLAKDGAAPLALQLLNTLGGLGGSLGGTINTRRLFELGTKVRTNPFRELFFERVDFRTFNFRHTFMPKNAGEVKQVKKIIDLFKFHMHPELLGGQKNTMFLYPSEFDIKYYYRTDENPFFNKISTCVLEDMNVEYGGDIFATFETGEPVEVNLSLRFREVELLTKENIDTRGL